MFLSNVQKLIKLNKIHSSGLELIASKWAHSLIELDLAWANVQDPLDNAIKAIAEKGEESPLKYVYIEKQRIHLCCQLANNLIT